MKVLKEPEVNPELWKKEYTCTGRGWYQEGRTPCGCLLEVNIGDIQERSHTDLGGETDTYYGFTCCKCGCFTEISKDDVPLEFRNMIRKYR